MKGVAYCSGDAELVAVDGATGSVLARRALDPGRDPGTRPSPFSDSLLLPAPAGIEVLDPRTLETRAVIPVAGGPGTLPVQRDSFALVVDRDGLLLLVDPATGTVRAQTPTGARGSSSVSPRILEEKACFADRTGLVVMVDSGEDGRALGAPYGRSGADGSGDRPGRGPGLRERHPLRLPAGRGAPHGPRPRRQFPAPSVPGVGILRDRDGGARRRPGLSLADPGYRPAGRRAQRPPLPVGDTLYVGTRGGKLVRIDVTKLPR
ncbi:MAG: hypothetical protein MZV63_57525 [Marinilabiliales bacterium]|nr:hypothetical protein [Marinilabiliales bacterium]